jgi:DNA-binding LacI/PurR family transcriptional regulator
VSAVTLKDVAARAKVHPATASRALHPATRHLVRPGTAHRVIRAADSLGYVRDHTALSLRTRSTRTVGVLLPDLADPLAAAFARGVEDQLAAAGYMALIGSTDCDAAREMMLLTVMRGRHVDGLILAGAAARAPLAAAARQTGLPVIAAGPVPDDGTLPAGPGGCGDLPPAGAMTPPLTTTRLPQYDLGMRAVRLLLDQIAAAGAPAVTRLLPPELVVHGSTAAARDKPGEALDQGMSTFGTNPEGVSARPF